MKWSFVSISLFVVIALGSPNPLLAQDLVVNGGFESGSEGWSGGDVVPDAPHTGTFCLRIVDDDYSGDVAARTRETLPISHDTAYTLEVWVRADADGREVMVSLSQYDGTGEWIPHNNMDFAVTAGTDWTRFSAAIQTFNADTAAVHINLRPAAWTPNGELRGTAWFDNIRFAVSTPGSTAHGSWLVPSGGVRVWLSPVEQKVGREQRLDAAAIQVSQIDIAAAGGEMEPFQLVLAPEEDNALTGVSISTLRGPQGAEVSATDMSVREVAYVEVVQPTDYASTVGLRPDPLPLLEAPLPLDGGLQQPLWFTVGIPEGLPAGDYTGSVRLEFAGGDDIEVALRLRVWGFDLPETSHFRTSYGLYLDEIDRYHHLEGDLASRRHVLRLYLERFAEHRVSPNDPFGDDWYGVRFANWNWEGGTAVSTTGGASEANRMLLVVDETTDASTSAATKLAVAVDPTASYRLSWDARTDGAHSYLVSLNQLDDEGDWIANSNIDFRHDGDGEWQSESVSLTADDLHPDAASVRIQLHAVDWTPGGELMGRTWFDAVSLSVEPGGENLVVNGDFDLPIEDIEISVDFTAFDAAAEWALDGLGFDSFVLGLPGFARGNWSGNEPGRLLSFDWGSEDYEALFTRALGSITNHLDERGWLSRAYAYWYDEPSPENYPMVAYGMELLERAEPRLVRLLTEEYDTSLDGLVDLWVPVLQRHDEEWASDRQALGEEVWWYVCTSERAPYPNNFIDQPGVAHRIRFWMAWRYGVQGSLYWGTNYWRQDPWVDPMTASSIGDLWGNGDGRLLYPPRHWADGQTRVEGPTPSIRWELIREGIEDYETFWMLREATDELETRGWRPDLTDRARALLDIPESIVRSLTEYTDDPTLLAEFRLRVGETLEECLVVLADGPGETPLDTPDAGQTPSGSDASGCDCRTVPSGGGGARAAFVCLLWLLLCGFRKGRGRG